MTERAAFQGDFADFKLVKTRSVVQLILEFAIEEGPELVRAFGLPQPGSPIKLAVARLAVAPQIEAAANQPYQNGKRAWADLTPTQQSAIRCNELPLQRFLSEVGDADVQDAKKAADYVRFACGVSSRAELAYKNANLWRDLEARYQAWLVVA